MVKVELKTLNDTRKLARLIRKWLHVKDFVLLNGDLAAGKTTFSKMLIGEFGIDDVVTSPTFVIMNQYESKEGVRINHMDAYRLLGLNHTDEWGMYLDEFIEAINIIEWPEIVKPLLPIDGEVIELTFACRFENDHETRTVEVDAKGKDVENEIFNAFRK